MTRSENIKAILECNFPGFKDELIENACKRIVAEDERLDKHLIRCRMAWFELTDVIEQITQNNNFDRVIDLLDLLNVYIDLLKNFIQAGEE